MSDCIFCKIVGKEIPNHTVFEDDGTLAFLDIFPCAKGHTVVIPKAHAETIFDLGEREYDEFFIAVKKTMERIQGVLASQGFTVGWNHGKAGGQAVPHVHVHVLPRYDGDGGGGMHSVVKNPGSMSVAEVAALFRS